MKFLKVLGICVPIGAFMCACRPRKGYRADPNKPPVIEKKHIPQRYIDRYNLREEEETQWFINEDYRKRFEEIYAKLILDSHDALDLIFFKDFILETFKKFSPFEESNDRVIKYRSLEITPLLARRSHEFIENCFRQPDSCKPRAFMHQREADDFDLDHDLYYNVVSVVFPIVVAHDMIRIVMLDIAVMGNSALAGQASIEKTISAFFSEEPLTDIAWYLDESEEEIEFLPDCSKFPGLEGEYTHNELCMINFLRNAFNHSVGFRYVDVLGMPGPEKRALRANGIDFVQGQVRVALPIPK